MNSQIINILIFDKTCIEFIESYFHNKIEHEAIYCITNSMYKLYNKNMYKIGKPLETILLTPKYFKIMSMKSKANKAMMIRDYYYELEQIIDQYKELIIKGDL